METKDLHEVWSHRWFSSKTKPGKSKIQGIGVFAVEEIAKGEKVAVLSGVIVPKTQIQEYWKTMGHLGIQINDDFFIVPTSRKEVETKGAFNHSCDPNVGFNDSITLVAIRDIKPDEELLLDCTFCESFLEEFDCNCGNECCRHHITADDWKLKWMQEKYEQYYSPYIRKRFKK